MHLQAKDSQPSPKAGRVRKDPPLEPSEGARPCRHLELGFLASTALLKWRGAWNRRCGKVQSFSPAIRLSQVRRLKVPSSLTDTDLALGVASISASCTPGPISFPQSSTPDPVAAQCQHRCEHEPEPQNMVRWCTCQPAVGCKVSYLRSPLDCMGRQQNHRHQNVSFMRPEAVFHSVSSMPGTVSATQ